MRRSRRIVAAGWRLPVASAATSRPRRDRQPLRRARSRRATTSAYASAATKRTRKVRITGRVRTTRRSLTLTRPRTLTFRKRGTRTVLLKLGRKGAREMTRVNRACAGSTVQITARRGPPAYRSAKRSLRRDLQRCLPGTPPGGPGSGYRVGVAARAINPDANGRVRRAAR